MSGAVIGAIGSVAGGALAGGAGQSRDSSQEVTTQLDPVQREGLQGVINAAQNQFRRGPQTFFPGSTVAPVSNLTLEGENLALSQLPQFAASAANQSGAVTNLLSGGPQFESVNAELEAALTNPIIRNLRESILPSIEQGAIQQGAFGGSRQGVAEGVALDRATGTIADVLARATLQGQAQQQGAIQAGLGFAPQVAQQASIPAQILQTVGEARTAREQAIIDAARERFAFEQAAPQNAILNLASALQGVNLGGTTTSTLTSGGGFDAGRAAGGAVIGNQFARAIGDIFRSGGGGTTTPTSNVNLSSTVPR